MIWVEGLQAVIDTLLEDELLVEALGGDHVYRNGEHNEYRVPAIYWTVVWNRIDENTEPFMVQLDVFANDINSYIALEGRIRRLLHRDTPHEVQGIPMLTQLDDARDHVDGEDYIHRSLDFRIEPARTDLIEGFVS